MLWVTGKWILGIEWLRSLGLKGKWRGGEGYGRAGVDTRKLLPTGSGACNFFRGDGRMGE